MLHVVESKKSVQEVEADFASVAAKHKFGVLGTHNLRQKLNEKGIPFDKDCLIFEVCQPLPASRVLHENMSISTALPCRVSVYSEGGTTRIATLRPTMLLEVFGAPGLKGVAEEVEKAIFAIMEDLR